MFKLGFFIGILSVILSVICANIYTALPDKKGGMCFDCYETYGFPFALYESGTILHLDEFIWAGVVADISIAIVFSLMLGLIFKYVWSKISSRPVSLN